MNLETTGALSSLIGVFLGLGSLYLSWLAFKAARESAIQSKNANFASQQALSKLATFSQIIDFNEVISTLSEIRSLTRNQTFAPLPEKIDTIVRLVIRARESSRGCSDREKVLSSTISELRIIQGAIEMSPTEQLSATECAKIVRKLSDLGDLLEPILVEFNENLQKVLS